MHGRTPSFRYIYIQITLRHDILFLPLSTCLLIYRLVYGLYDIMMMTPFLYYIILHPRLTSALLLLLLLLPLLLYFIIASISLLNPPPDSALFPELRASVFCLLNSSRHPSTASSLFFYFIFDPS